MTQKAEKHRYIVTIEFHVWAETDEEALKEAYRFAKESDDMNDNRCRVTNVINNEFGSLTERQVYPKPIKKTHHDTGDLPRV